jgi:Zn-dependent alcohol dehydrogenase
MKTRAAAAWKAGAPLSIEKVDLDGPRVGDVLVEVRVTGICHADPAFGGAHGRGESIRSVVVY